MMSTWSSEIPRVRRLRRKHPFKEPTVWVIVGKANLKASLSFGAVGVALMSRGLASFFLDDAFGLLFFDERSVGDDEDAEGESSTALGCLSTGRFFGCDGDIVDS